jgi:hypothetical protein
MIIQIFPSSKQIFISCKTSSWSSGFHPEGTGAEPVQDAKQYGEVKLVVLAASL